MKVFLFGAGASHSYSLSSSGVRPPLAKGFFDAYKKLSIVNDPHVLVGAIVAYVRETRGISPIDFSDWSENIEDFLTEIYEQIGNKKRILELPIEQRYHLSKAYDEMVFLFSSVLNEIQNGSVCDNYNSLVHSLNPDDILITFNWDTLLDRALWESGRWYPTNGYGLEFGGFFDNGWQQNPKNPIKANSINKLIKLHGSTNWLMPYMALHLMTGERVFINKVVDPSTRPIFCFIKSDDVYATYQNRSKTGYTPFSYYYYPPDIPITKPMRGSHTQVGIVNNMISPDHLKVTVGGFPFASMPLLIPPVRHKEYGILGNALDVLWQQALDALINCEELTIIGYSFPVTDIRSWRLFEEASRNRRTPLQVKVVDPYPDQLVQRIESRLNKLCSTEIRKSTFSEYIASGMR
jgi:hypothetical protein